MFPTTSKEDEERGQEASPRHMDEHQQGDVDGNAHEAPEGERALEAAESVSPGAIGFGAR
jgi:hypothetical protein